MLCVEADPALAALARESIPATLSASGKVAFIESASPEEVAMRARSMGRFRAASSIALSGGEALNAELYRRMAALVSADIESGWRNRAALMVMGRLWMRNILANVAALPSIRPEAPPRFPGAAFVCGAGPSLEDALPFIVAHRESLSLVACDTALGSLLQSGIEPDLLVCLEGQAHNLSDFTPLGNRPLRSIADLSSHPATFRALAGTKHLSFAAFTDSPFLRRLERTLDSLALPYLAMPPLGSVGVHAVHLARRLARGPVFAVGLDFSFEPGKTHARGSPSILSEERKLSRVSRWNGQFALSFRTRSFAAPCAPLPDGMRLLSDPVLLSYAALLSEYRTAAGAALYDIRGRGPAIGATILTFDEVAGLLGDSRRLERPGEKSMLGDRGNEEAVRPPAEALSAALGVFLEGERSRLEEIRHAMKGRISMDASRYSTLLSDVDYLYWSFPDADRAKDLPRDFLNRLLPEIEFWSWRVESALDTLRESD
jgi:hypothetical protein